MTAAKRATFDADPQRRALLAKVHIAPKQLGMDKSDYHALLLRVTGKESAADCAQAELDAMMAEFTRMGFRAEARPGAQRQSPRYNRSADHPSARKARALWISLYHLGVVRNASEQALEAIAKRQLGCERLAWARQSDCARLIEALKAMAERAGWSQRGPKGEALSVEELQKGLCVAILARLKAGGALPMGMDLSAAIVAFGGLRPGREGTGPVRWPAVAAAMGARLHEAGLARDAEDEETLA